MQMVGRLLQDRKRANGVLVKQKKKDAQEIKFASPDRGNFRLKK